MPTYKNNNNSSKRINYSSSTGWNSGRSSSFSGTRTGGWNTGRSTSSFGNSGWNTTGNRSWSTGTGRSTGATQTWSSTSPQFTPIKNECQARIGSYKNVFSQFNGRGKTAFSPSAANKWLKFVNNGTLVYKFTSQQFNQSFGSRFSQLAPSACVRAFQQQFGAGVKAVCRGNNGSWLIAATTNVTANPFRNYNWR